VTNSLGLNHNFRIDSFARIQGWILDPLNHGNRGVALAWIFVHMIEDVL